jgi:hypothetical protein
MIERYVFIKLKPEHRGERALAELVSRSQRLGEIPGVRSVTIAAPADAAALAAWDLCMVLRFEQLAAADAYLAHQEHESYFKGFLEPRVQVVKAWNFEAKS